MSNSNESCQNKWISNTVEVIGLLVFFVVVIPLAVQATNLFDDWRDGREPATFLQIENVAGKLEECEQASEKFAAWLKTTPTPTTGQLSDITKKLASDPVCVAIAIKNISDKS